MHWIQLVEFHSKQEPISTAELSNIDSFLSQPLNTSEKSEIDDVIATSDAID